MSQELTNAASKFLRYKNKVLYNNKINYNNTLFQKYIRYVFINSFSVQTNHIDLNNKMIIPNEKYLQKKIKLLSLSWAKMKASSSM